MSRSWDRPENQIDNVWRELLHSLEAWGRAIYFHKDEVVYYFTIESLHYPIGQIYFHKIANSWTKLPFDRDMITYGNEMKLERSFTFSELQTMASIVTQDTDGAPSPLTHIWAAPNSWICLKSLVRWVNLSS